MYLVRWKKGECVDNHVSEKEEHDTKNVAANQN